MDRFKWGKCLIRDPKRVMLASFYNVDRTAVETPTYVWRIFEQIHQKP